MGLFSAISDAVNSVVDAVQDVVGSVVDTVQDGANSLVDGAQGLLEGVIGDTFLSDIIDGIQYGVNGAVDFVQDGAELAVDAAQGLYGAGAGAIDFFTDPLIPDFLEDPAEAALTGGGQLLAGLIEAAGENLKIG